MSETKYLCDRCQCEVYAVIYSEDGSKLCSACWERRHLGPSETEEDTVPLPPPKGYIGAVEEILVETAWVMCPNQWQRKYPC